VASLRFFISYVLNFFRALFGTPARAGWSKRYDALVRMLKAEFVAGQSLESAERRALVDRSLGASYAQSSVTITHVITGGIPAMWVVPKGALGPPRPLIVYLHGGGYQSGSLLSHAALAASLAVASKARLLSVDYRLAPEFPHPAALDDVLSVVAWLRENGHEHLVFAGDGSGAHLALLAMLRLRDRKETLPLRAGLMSPWVDLASTGTAVNEAFDVVTGASLAGDARAFLMATDPASGQVSPTFAELRDLPPLLVQSGTAEVLHADVVAFVKKARSAGVDATLTEFPDMIHTWHRFAPKGVPEAQRAIEQLGEFLGKPLPSKRQDSRPEYALPAGPASPG
jgi:phosphinothricin tripeptide acetyl hydrolase